LQQVFRQALIKNIRMLQQKNSTVKTIIGNLKGGVGKSTLTNLFAVTLASNEAMQSIGFENGFKVLVVDSDYQRSLYQKRQRDKRKIEKTDIYDVICVSGDDIRDLRIQEEIELLRMDDNGFKYYDLKWNSKDDMGIASTTVQEQILYHYNEGPIFDNYDFVFFDLVGTIAQGSNVRKAYALADNIIIPVLPSHNDTSAVLDFFSFANRVSNVRRKGDFETNVCAFLNCRANSSLSKDLPEILEAVAARDNIDFLKVSIGQREALRKANGYEPMFVNKSIEKYNKAKGLNKRYKDMAKYEFTLLFQTLYSFFFDIVTVSQSEPVEEVSIEPVEQSTESVTN